MNKGCVANGALRGRVRTMLACNQLPSLLVNCFACLCSEGIPFTKLLERLHLHPWLAVFLPPPGLCACTAPVLITRMFARFLRNIKLCCICGCAEFLYFAVTVS
jgi:hypothetical protein